MFSFNLNPSLHGHDAHTHTHTGFEPGTSVIRPINNSRSAQVQLGLLKELIDILVASQDESPPSYSGYSCPNKTERCCCLTGTTKGGEFDGYFGESGNQDPGTPAYNASAVFHSAAGKALARALQARFGRPTREEVMYSLRSSATLRCEPNSTFNAPPCNPAQSGEPCL